jgi:hypothetical protein
VRLYLAGNFTITDEVHNEVAMKETLGKDYNRLCTFYYPKAADVIIKNEKPDIPKKVIINKHDLETKNHSALKGACCDQKESKTQKEDNQKEVTTPKRRRVVLRKRKNP